MSRRPSKEEAASLQYQIEHQAVRKAPSVIPYLVILAAAAFLLLVMAYFMQRRTAQSVEELNQSVDSFQTIDQLVTDNQSLRGEVDRLKAELKEAQEQSKALSDRLDDLQNGPEAQDARNRVAVLTSFTMLEQALRDKNYQQAALHVKTLCSGAYDLDLGLASETEAFSPAQRLEEIIPLLVRQKALTQGEVTVP